MHYGCGYKMFKYQWNRSNTFTCVRASLHHRVKKIVQKCEKFFFISKMFTWFSGQPFWSRGLRWPDSVFSGVNSARVLTWPLKKIKCDCVLYSLVLSTFHKFYRYLRRLPFLSRCFYMTLTRCLCGWWSLKFNRFFMVG